MVNNLHGEGEFQFVIFHLKEEEWNEKSNFTMMLINALCLEACREGRKLLLSKEQHHKGCYMKVLLFYDFVAAFKVF